VRRAAVRWAGLPHSSGTIDSPSPEVAHELTMLWRRNAVSRARIVDPRSTETVTMTTHGARLRNTWAAIESIGRGTVLPRRIILWLDEPNDRLPWRLRQLQRRGLEVNFTAPGLGVHTKYWPYLTSAALDGALVTSDDDILYPPNWLELLRAAHARHPDRVIAHRTKVVSMASDDEFAPYITWPECTSDEPSFAHLATSVSGQLLPPSLQRAIRDDGPVFLGVSKANDDVWLHREAVLHGFPTQQVSRRAEHWPFVPGSQVVALSYSNVFGGENDGQLAAAHNAETRAKIWRSIEDDRDPTVPPPAR
jgi:hypothetical protein